MPLQWKFDPPEDDDVAHLRNSADRVSCTGLETPPDQSRRESIATYEATDKLLDHAKVAKAKAQGLTARLRTKTAPNLDASDTVAETGENKLEKNRM